MNTEERTQRIDAEDDERAQGMAAGHDVDGPGQDSTRRLVMYEEEREYTRRLEPSAPWDVPDPSAEQHWQPQEQAAVAADAAIGRRWSTTALLLSTLLGVVLGAFGVLTATNGTQEQITVLDSQLRDTQGAVQERDRRIADLERQLEDARSRPLGVELPESLSDFSLPELRLPGLEFLSPKDRRDLRDEVQERIDDAAEDRRGRD